MGWPNCRSAKFERSLPKSQELNSELQSKRSSIILGQDIYNIHYPIEFKKSDNKTALCALKSKTGWGLSGLLPAKEASTLTTTATSITGDKLASLWSKWWEIGSYASKCAVTSHSKDEQRAIKTLAQTTRFTGERCENRLQWWEDEVKLPSNFDSAMGQLKSIEQRLEKDDMLRKHYQEIIVSDFKAVYIRKVEQVEQSETRDKLQWFCATSPCQQHS